jgi:hypothetical protein
MRRALTILAVLLVAVAVLVPATSARTDPGPLRILVVGDSIAEPCSTAPVGGWCARLDVMLRAVDVVPQWSTLALPGARCRWAADRIGAALNAHDPDVVLLNCGTNDDPKEKCWGESCTAWAQRVIIEAAHNSGARVATAFVGYPDLLRFGSQVNQEAANDAIYSNLGLYTTWNLGLANFQQVPGNPDYLPDGIHPTGPKGADAYARIWFEVGAGRGWWPAGAALPLCGMFGRRAGYSVPAYLPCS